MRKGALSAILALLASTPVMAASPGDVVINEVCWLGSTVANQGFYDEWIELYNNTGAPIDLAGWTIDEDAGSTIYSLSGTIEAGAYFLIEKREQATSVPADLVVAEMNLGNAGDSLELQDDGQNRIDYLDTAAGWYAGGDLGDVQHYSMERRDPVGPGNLAYNWGANDGVTINDTDSGGNPLFSTPRAENSLLGTVLPGPEVTHIHCLDVQSIDLIFSEAVEETSAETPGNYLIDDFLSPAAALLDETDARLVTLLGITGLDTGELVDLTVSGVRNLTGGPSQSMASYVTGVVPVNYVRTDLDSTGIPDLIEANPAAFFTVEGIVTSAGDYDTRDARFQDDSGGLAIWDSLEETVLDLARGDRIRISGNLSQNGGMDQIINVRSETLDQNNPVAKTPLTLAELLAAAEVYENMLVLVSAVSDTGAGDAWPTDGQDANLEVSDDGGTSLITLRVDQETDIDGSAEPDYPVDLAGIVGQYDSSEPYYQGYHITPRDLMDIGTQCEDLDQDGYGNDCISGPDCDDANPDVNPGAGELCDGVDNNCDSATDEDWPELGQACDGPDEDLCEAGSWICSAAQDDIQCDDPGAHPELCNGIDDDCDDSTDEDFPELGEACDGSDDDTCENGTYVCADDGTLECDEPVEQHQETCNGIDDDCDGETDEELGTYTCGAGECAVTVDRCIAGQWQECVPGQRPMETETGEYCSDGLDNNCNGFVDDKDSDCRSGTSDGCGCTSDRPGTSWALLILILVGACLRRNRSPCA